MTAAGPDLRARHERWMRRALDVADPSRKSPRTARPAEPAADQASGSPAAVLAPGTMDVGLGDVPIGAVVYDADGTELAAARNEREARGDPTAHAEILALRAAAARLGTWRLTGCTLVVSVEPCTMCAGALILARIATVVFGAWEPKTGAVGSLWDVVRDRRLNHRPEVYGGVLEAESAAILSTYFARHRN